MTIFAIMVITDSMSKRVLRLEPPGVPERHRLLCLSECLYGEEIARHNH